MKENDACLLVRPFELMQLIARVGAGYAPPDLKDERLSAIASAIAANPRIPLGFRLYDGDRYYGRDEQAPDGVLFSLLADLEIINRLFAAQSEAAFVFKSGVLGSGAAILGSVAASIRKGNGLEEICPGRAAGLPEIWAGPDSFRHEDYEKGRPLVQKWIQNLIPNYNVYKTDQELAAIRKTSVAEMNQADVLRIFPSHLLYILAYFGACADLLRGEPMLGDNMYEVGMAMRRNPDIPLMFVAEHCMLCPTCKAYDPDGCGLCGVQPACLLKSASRNSMCNRLQLRLLRSLGMEYYQPAPAATIVRKAFAKVRTNHTSFTYRGSPPGAYAYTRCRYAGMGFLDAYENPQKVVQKVAELLTNDGVRAILPADDRRHMETILDQAREALQRGDQPKAYQALIDEPFVFLWKFYLEKIAAGFARLPETIRVERREENGLPAVTAERAKTPADLTGRLEAPAWNTRPFAGGFRTIAGRPAIADTAFRVLYDDQALIIGCLGADSRPADIQANHRIGFDARIGADCCRADPEHWAHVDDSFTIGLQPDETADNFFMFTFNARGVKIGEQRRTEAFIKNPDWIRDTDWQVRTQIDQRAWSGVAVIPFACLGVKNPGQTRWRLNVYRFFRNELLDAHYWSYPGPRKFYLRSAFGRLAFA